MISPTRWRPRLTLLDAFLIEIDRAWPLREPHKISLRIIGSMALMLQAEYQRGTKDSDILEADTLTPRVKEALLKLAKQGTLLAKKHRMYLDVVSQGLLMLPGRPLFHPLPELTAQLEHFEVEVLDIVDVVVSKLKPYRPSDIEDIAAMASQGHLDPESFLERFRSAIDRFMDGSQGSEKLSDIVKNFHAVQRDHLFTAETPIDLPDWADEP
jgi:Nucleotidyltransferase of unknown function (DUF6036)